MSRHGHHWSQAGLVRSCGRIPRNSGRVSAPVDRHRWPACRRRTSEQHGFSLSACFFKGVEDRAVIKLRIAIVHALRIRAGMILHVDGNSLAEISLEAVDAHPDQAL